MHTGLTYLRGASCGSCQSRTSYPYACRNADHTQDAGSSLFEVICAANASCRRTDHLSNDQRWSNSWKPSLHLPDQYQKAPKQARAKSFGNRSRTFANNREQRRMGRELCSPHRSSGINILGFPNANAVHSVPCTRFCIPRF